MTIKIEGEAGEGKTKTLNLIWEFLKQKGYRDLSWSTYRENQMECRLPKEICKTCGQEIKTKLV